MFQSLIFQSSNEVRFAEVVGGMKAGDRSVPSPYG
jgi:hypothetical protein